MPRAIPVIFYQVRRSDIAWRCEADLLVLWRRWRSARRRSIFERVSPGDRRNRVASNLQSTSAWHRLKFAERPIGPVPSGFNRTMPTRIISRVRGSRFNTLRHSISSSTMVLVGI